MELELFNFIDETIKYYELKKPSFTYVEGQLVSLFKEVAGESSDTLLSVKSRVKSSESLREKLIRNRFYLNCFYPLLGAHFSVVLVAPPLLLYAVGFLLLS